MWWGGGRILPEAGEQVDQIRCTARVSAAGRNHQAQDLYDDRGRKVKENLSVCLNYSLPIILCPEFFFIWKLQAREVVITFWTYSTN